MGALEAIPLDAVAGDWLCHVVAEAKRLTHSLGEHWATTAATRARRHEEKRSAVRAFEVGELVLLAKPFYEKRIAAILPQCSGFFLMQSVAGHTAQLADPTSGEPTGPRARTRVRWRAATRLSMHCAWGASSLWLRTRGNTTARTFRVWRESSGSSSRRRFSCSPPHRTVDYAPLVGVDRGRWCAGS